MPIALKEGIVPTVDECQHYRECHQGYIETHRWLRPAIIVPVLAIIIGLMVSVMGFSITTANILTETRLRAMRNEADIETAAREREALRDRLDEILYYVRTLKPQPYKAEEPE